MFVLRSDGYALEDGGADMSDVHKHKCDGCGHVWKHDRDKISNMKKAHTCKECGQEQRYRYSGPEDAPLDEGDGGVWWYVKDLMIRWWKGT